MEGLWSDCFKMYSGRFIVKTCSYESYLIAVMDGKESTEVSIIEKFLFSKSGAVVNEVSFR
jgi:hypothetical protein